MMFIRPTSNRLSRAPGAIAMCSCLLAMMAWGCGGGADESDSPEAAGVDSDAPSLVVVLAVDQLRNDLLDHYGAAFTGGLRRVMTEGFRYTNATHDHAVTSTAPGHTTLSSGVYPTRHGIVGNSWHELRDGEWQSVYSMFDPDAPLLGHPELPGRSPANMLRGGLADWVQQADSESRIVSLSRKDRAAIGLAGKARGEVYWLSRYTDEFITSTYYHDALPEWVRQFNLERMPEVYGDTLWSSTIPESAIALSRPDTSEYEGFGRSTYFPHSISEAGDPTEEGAASSWRYSYSPFPDRAVLALATHALDELDLGQRGSLDYLGVSLSQADIIGHRYGPMSREQLDTLLRLDRALAGFFTMLDTAVGPDRWVLVVSADHGVLDVTEHLAEEGVDARRLERADFGRLQSTIDGVLEGVPAEADSAQRAIAVRDAILELEFVGGAYTYEQVEAMDPVADTFQVLFSRSHSRDRAVSYSARYGVHSRWLENSLGWAQDPASHGSPYHYDRQVPVVFMGPGIEAGSSEEPVATVDVAPTLAALLGIAAPADVDGRVLHPGR